MCSPETPTAHHHALAGGLANHLLPTQARAADLDRKKTIVLRFPKGYALPSQSQVYAVSLLL